jgi:hypothetical protein
MVNGKTKTIYSSRERADFEKVNNEMPRMRITGRFNPFKQAFKLE